MRKRILVGCGALALAFAVLLGVEWFNNPSRRWQPPTVELPVPNAFDDYLRAGELASENYDFNKPDDSPSSNVAVRRRILAENAEALKVLRGGFAHAYVEPRPSDPDTAQPYYAKFRKLARVLSYEATEHASNGRYAAALDSQLDAMRLGFDVPRRAGIIGLLVGIAARAIGRGEKMVQPRLDHLTAAEARAAATRLAGLLAGEQSLAQTIADERDIELARRAKIARSASRFQLARSMPGDDNPRAALPLALFGAGPWMAEYRRYMDAAAAWSKLPWNATPPPHPNRWFAWADEDANLLNLEKCKHLAADAHDRMFLAALALQAWRAAHGAYPDTLEALVPDILGAVPADPFGNGPLKYRRAGDKYALYSVGPDGQDDGGEPAVQRAKDDGQWHYNEAADSRGDLVWVTSTQLMGKVRP